MGGFLMVGLFGLLGVIVLGLFVDLSAFQMAISAGVVLLMGGLILYQTSAIIHGGETNYILATVTLYVSLYNIFRQPADAVRPRRRRLTTPHNRS